MPLAWGPAASTGPARSVASCSKTPTRFGYNPQSRVCGYEPSAPGLHLFTAEMRPPRDAALKRFALNTDLLWHLLRACPLDGLDGAQIANIKPASANLIGPDVSQRLTDAAWRIEVRDGSLACLLLECQADTDPTMPFRALHSVATLALKLSRDPPQRYSPSRSPPILHLTLYTGRRA